MTDTTKQASFTEQEKQGLANDLGMLVSMSVEHGQYIFNLIAAVNVLNDILTGAKIVSEEELKTKIEAELVKMKDEFLAAQKEAPKET